MRVKGGEERGDVSRRVVRVQVKVAKTEVAHRMPSTF